MKNIAKAVLPFAALRPSPVPLGPRIPQSLLVQIFQMAWHRRDLPLGLNLIYGFTGLFSSTRRLLRRGGRTGGADDETYVGAYGDEAAFATGGVPRFPPCREGRGGAPRVPRRLPTSG